MATGSNNNIHGDLNTAKHRIYSPDVASWETASGAMKPIAQKKYTKQHLQFTTDKP